MEEQKPIGHIAAGLIIAAILIIYNIVINFMGLSQSQALGWLSYGILIGGLAYFINQHGKSTNYQAGFGQLFSYGFKASSIITLIMVLFIVAFFSFFPEFKEKMMELTRQNLENQQGMDDDKIDEVVAMFDKNFILMTGGGALFMYLVLGLIGSLIGAAITKKRPSNPFDQQTT